MLTVLHCWTFWGTLPPQWNFFLGKWCVPLESAAIFDSVKNKIFGYLSFFISAIRMEDKRKHFCSLIMSISEDFSFFHLTRRWFTNWLVDSLTVLDPLSLILNLFNNSCERNGNIATILSWIDNLSAIFNRKLLLFYLLHISEFKRWIMKNNQFNE